MRNKYLSSFVLLILLLEWASSIPSTLYTLANLFKRTAGLPCFHLIAWGICLNISSPVFSQSHSAEIQRHGLEKGLSHREVQCIFQDREGAIWVGARFGLNRFDGYQFKKWQAESHGQGVNFISRIGQDDEGMLWLWNHEGILFLDPVTEKFYTPKERFGQDLPFDPKLIAQRSWKYWDVRSIPSDAAGRLYLSNLSGAFFTFHSKEGFKKHVVEGAKLVEIADVDKTGQVWGYDGRTMILKMNEKGRVIERIKVPIPMPNPKDLLLTKRYLTNFFEKGMPGFSVSGQNGDRINLREGVNLEFINPVLKQLWINVSDGYEVWSETGELLLTLSSKDLPGKLDNGFNCILTDKSGRIWIGSDFGLISIGVRPTKFKRHFYFNDESQKPFNNSARGMTVDGDELLVNFEMGGLVSISANKPANDFQLLNRSLGIYEGEPPVNGRYKYWSRPLLAAGHGTFWIGGRNFLRLFDKNTGKIEQFGYLPSEGTETPIDLWSLYSGPAEVLWIGTGNGLVYKKAGEPGMRVFRDYGRFASLTNAFVLYLHEAPNRRIWLCTNQGLYLFDPLARKVLEGYGMNFEGKHFLPSNNFQHIYNDTDGTLWLATTEGLIHWDYQAKKFEQFTTLNGLSDNNIYAVYPDGHKGLWLSSDHGIMRFGQARHTVQTYLPGDGTTALEFNRISHYQAPDSSIYFGSMNGVTSFRPADFLVTDSLIQAVKMFISDYRIFNEKSGAWEDHTGELRQYKTILMAPNNPFLALDVAVLDYGRTNMISYAYRVKDFSENWFIQRSRNILLNRMPYGHHVLQVQGRLTGSNQVLAQLDLDIYVEKPFYLANWCLLTAAALFLGLVFGIYKLRLRNLKAQKAKLESQVKLATAKIEQDKLLIEQQVIELTGLNKLKDGLFAILGHDLRKPALAFRGLSKKLAYLIEKQDMRLLQKIAVYLERDANSLYSLTENIFNWALAQKGELIPHPTNLDISETIADVLDIFEGPITVKQIHLLNEVEGNTILWADPYAVSTIVRNLVDNAVKFTPKSGTISLSAERRGNSIGIRVKNSGEGISEEKVNEISQLGIAKSEKGTAGEKGTGLGLYLVQELLLANGGRLDIERKLHDGVMFIAWLPAA